MSLLWASNFMPNGLPHRGSTCVMVHTHTHTPPSVSRISPLECVWWVGGSGASCLVGAALGQVLPRAGEQLIALGRPVPPHDSSIGKPCPGGGWVVRDHHHRHGRSLAKYVPAYMRSCSSNANDSGPAPRVVSRAQDSKGGGGLYRSSRWGRGAGPGRGVGSGGGRAGAAAPRASPVAARPTRTPPTGQVPLRPPPPHARTLHSSLWATELWRKQFEINNYFSSSFLCFDYYLFVIRSSGCKKQVKGIIVLRDGFVLHIR
jgi:hypothetical protein